MKKEGIVTNYDGYTGTIKDYYGKEYLLLKKETLENINEKDIPDFDLMTWGFPCQDISIARKDERNREK